jgi:hypothetical protein
MYGCRVPDHVQAEIKQLLCYDTETALRRSILASLFERIRCVEENLNR